MGNKPYFPILEGEIAKNGIDKKELAKKLGLSMRAFYSKMLGNNDFKLSEIKVILSVFPDVPFEKLFSHDATA